MNAAQRNQLMRTIVTLNKTERTLNALALLFPSFADLAKEVAAANRNVAQVRTAHKPAATKAPTPAACR